MKVIVLAATTIEISLLIESLEARFEEKRLGCNIYNVKKSGNDIRIIESGPGLSNVSAASAMAIERFDPEHIFNLGVCGVYSGDNGFLTKAITGKYAVFADAGVESQGCYQDMEDIDLPFFSKESGEDFYNRIDLCDDNVSKAVLRGVFLSLSAVSGGMKQAEKIKKRFYVENMLMCEDMETAGAALTALRAGIPCTAIRGISNLCGDRNYQNWRLKEAAEAAQKEFLKVVKPNV